MPYDATLPVDHSPIVAAELRNQFAGLKDLIDAVPTSSAMATVLTAQTAGHCEYIPPPVLPVSDPPTQAEVQAIAQFVNDLYVALTRT